MSTSENTVEFFQGVAKLSRAYIYLCSKYSWNHLFLQWYNIWENKLLTVGR